MAREGVSVPVIQRQLGHAHLGVTSTYLQGIDTSEIINTIHARRAPMIPASAGLRLQAKSNAVSGRTAGAVPLPRARG